MPGKHKKIDNLIETSLVSIFLILVSNFIFISNNPRSFPLLGYRRIYHSLFYFIINQISLGPGQIKMNYCPT